jgi:endonuclease YncB( thermonuclease family)
MILFLVLSFVGNEHDIIVEKVHDGDTITATINLGFDVQLAHKEIRIEGFDAFEINKVRRTVKVTDEEIAKGKLAKTDLEELLKQAKRVYVLDGKQGAYGRLELRLFICDTFGDDQEVSLIMMLAGYDRTREKDYPLIGIPKLRKLQEKLEEAPKVMVRRHPYPYNFFEGTPETYDEWYKRVGPIIPAGD